MPCNTRAPIRTSTFGAIPHSSDAVANQATSASEEVPTRSPESEALSRALRAHGFRFVGPTTMHALMEAVGIVDTHLLGSHRRGSSGVWPEAPEGA